jgi:hypothetical protein
MSEPSDRQEAFVKVSVNAPDHYKVRRLASRLGSSKNEAFGAVVRLWSWLPEHASMGRLELSPEELAVVMELDALGPEEVVRALVEARLVDRDGEDALVVHGWLDQPHTGAFYQQRSVAGALGAHKRWHVQEGIVEPSCSYCQPQTDSNMPSQVAIADQDQDQDQEKREEPPTEPLPGPAAPPLGRRGDPDEGSGEEKSTEEEGYPQPPPDGVNAPWFPVEQRAITSDEGHGCPINGRGGLWCDVCGIADSSVIEIGARQAHPDCAQRAGWPFPTWPAFDQRASPATFEDGCPVPVGEEVTVDG